MATAPTQRLTVPKIEAALAAHRETWLSDNSCRRGVGRLVLRIYANGTGAFYFRYSVDGKKRSVALGKYASANEVDGVQLEEARDLADEKSRLYRSHIGDGPTLERDLFRGFAPTRPARLSESTSSLRKLCEVYVAHLRSHKKESPYMVENEFKNHVLTTRWADAPARSVTAEDITDILRPMVQQEKYTTAGHVRSSLRAAFKLAKDAGIDANASGDFKHFGIKDNPVVDTAVVKNPRPLPNRNLNPLELGFFWNELNAPEIRNKTAVRLIKLSVLLGGQRCRQLLRCTLADVDFYEETVDLFDIKGRRPAPRFHQLPMTASIKSEVEWLIRNSRLLGSTFLFPGGFRPRRDGPMCCSTVSTTTRAVSDTLLLNGRFKSPFRYADLRRTLESRMIDIGVPTEVRGQILSHGLGGIQEQRYVRHNYMKAKRAALEDLYAYLERCGQAARAAVASGRYASVATTAW